MARIRTLKPEILEDERTAELSDPAFRLFVSMIVLADDFGNCRADDRYLRAQVWWARGESPQVAAILGELAQAGLILAYQVRGQMYVHLRGWEKHQRIDNRGKPRVPGPKDSEAEDITIPVTPTRGNSPRNAASLGETPLDHDHDHDHEGDMSGKPDVQPSIGSDADHVDAVTLFAETAIHHINTLARTSYRADSTATVKLCRALVKAKHTPDEARAVISSKRNWLNDDKMREYFRPATLLALSKFEQYLDELEGKQRKFVVPVSSAPAVDDFELAELPWVPMDKAAS